MVNLLHQRSGSSLKSELSYSLVREPLLVYKSLSQHMLGRTLLRADARVITAVSILRIFSDIDTRDTQNQIFEVNDTV